MAAFSKLALVFIALYSFDVGATPTEVKRSNPVTVPLTKSLHPPFKRNPHPHLPPKASVPETNLVQSYSAPVTVGRQKFDLLIDTGSSTIFVGGGSTKYIGGPKAVNLNQTYENDYASGFSFGEAFNDTVTIGPYTVTDFPIGNSTLVSLPILSGTDGIIGLGPVDLTLDIITGPLSAGYDTFPTRLKKTSGIDDIVGIYFKPEKGNDTADVNGELTFGGYDPSKIKGKITYVPITNVTRPPFNYYWGIDVAKIYVGSTVVQSTSAASIVDTGTTWLLIPYDVYNAFNTLTGAKPGPYGYPSWTTRPTENLTFNIGGTNFTLTPEDYIIPPAQLSNWNGPGYTLDPNLTWSWILNGGPDDGFTLNFIFGQMFLQSFYTIYDGEKNRVGFAEVH